MNNKERAVEYWSVGQQFLQLSSFTSEKIAKSGNKSIILSNRPLSIREIDRKTKWSDLSISIPVLFNFYHGIELILKGYIIFSNNEDRTTHRISNLLEYISEQIGKDNEFIILLDKYINPKENIISDFLTKNNINIDNWYQALKYPESNQRIKYNHFSLKYGGDRTIEFWQELSKDSLEIIRLARKYHLENREDSD